jgi:hypothetical protein
VQGNQKVCEAFTLPLGRRINLLVRIVQQGGVDRVGEIEPVTEVEIVRHNCPSSMGGEFVQEDYTFPTTSIVVLPPFSFHQKN